MPTEMELKAILDEGPYTEPLEDVYPLLQVDKVAVCFSRHSLSRHSHSATLRPITLHRWRTSSVGAALLSWSPVVWVL